MAMVPVQSAAQQRREFDCVRETIDRALGMTGADVERAASIVGRTIG